MTVTGARWDVGELFALAREIPNIGFDLDLFAPDGEDWTGDTSSIVQAAIVAASDAGGGEVVVRDEGRTYLWQAVQMRSRVGLRFLGRPTIRKASSVAATHIIDFLGTEDPLVASALVADHPLASPLTVSTASWVTNVATITVGSGHGVLPGDQVRVLGITPTGYNHLATVTGVTSTTISFALTTNPGSYSSGGSVKVLPFNVHPVSATGFSVGDVVCVMDDTYAYALTPTVAITAASWSAGIATVTFSASPQTAAGDGIVIAAASSSGPGSFNGTFMTLSRVANTVTYALQTDPGAWSSGGTGVFAEGQSLELAKITAITGDQIVLDHALRRDYATASNARLVRLNAVEDAYLAGQARFEIPDGTLGGNLYWQYAYNVRARDVDCYGSNDDPAFYTVRSARVLFDGCGAYDGQRLDLGGVGYGFAIGGSSHDVRVTNWRAERVRENQATNGAMDIVFEDFSVMWTYDDAINTHGSGLKRVRIANGQIGYCQGAGVTVGFGTCRASDEDVTIENMEIFDCEGTGVAVKGNDDGTKNMKRIKIRGVRVIRPGGSYGYLLQHAEDSDLDGIEYIGDGVADQIAVYAADSSDIGLRRLDLKGGGSDYGVKWENVAGLDLEPGQIRDFASHNLWGVTSSDVTLRAGAMDDTDVVLEGTETLVGSDALAGALSTSYSDADITPDPAYRVHVWSPTASRAIHEPSAAKRALGQRITFDISNAGIGAIIPDWDPAFVLSSPFVVRPP